jgi:hypothetical protein
LAPFTTALARERLQKEVRNIAVAVSFGVNISKEQQDAKLALAAPIDAILLAADAHV